jgi:signal transduction histidine kinase
MAIAEHDRSVTKAAHRRRQVHVEQVRSVYLHSTTTTIGSLFAGTALVAVMWRHVSHAGLIAWIAFLCVHQAVRVYHYRSYLAAGPDGQAERWRRLYIIIAAATAGLIWGSSGVLMYVPGSLPHQAMLVLILFGIATVSMTSLSAVAPAFYALIPLTLLPIIVRMLLDPGPARVYLAIPGIIVFFVVLAFGRRVNAVIRESLEKRFENVDLIDDLRAQTEIAEQARRNAEAANRAKTQFFAAASHDLRQPLHALGLFAGALYERIKEPALVKLVDSINDSVSALEGLFNELLDIAKLDSGIIKPAPENFPLDELFNRLRKDFAAEAEAKGLRFSLEGGSHAVMSDPLLLECILRNLVSNAIRYTPHGEVQLRAVAEDESAIRIEVRDTGIGIRPEDQERIFEEFQQLGNPGRTSKKGLGLGLSIVKRLCGLLGYEIHLRSEAGQGACFSFQMPRGALSGPARSGERKQRPRADLSGKLIIVIDDEASIVEGMEVLLSGWGVEVIGSLTGDDVIEAVHAKLRMPDIIIADYRLADGVLGTQVVARLREELDPEIPVILITGSTAPEHVSNADVQGYQLLLKPVQPNALRELIDAALNAGRPADATP